MRQLTEEGYPEGTVTISKLPMRQLTAGLSQAPRRRISKLPMRQLTMRERKKNPTARTLIHLSPTLTQIYSCFEIY